MSTITGSLIQRAIPPLTTWLIAQAMESPRVRKALRKADANVLRMAVRQRHMLPRRLMRVAVGLAFIVAGGVILARSPRALAV